MARLAYLVTLLPYILILSINLKPVSFINADLPRLLINGQLIWENVSVPTTNLYSYTYPEYKTPMHHWGSSVVLFLVSQYSGTIGLHLFGISLNLITVGLLHRLACKQGSRISGLVALVLCLPIISLRTEIRPELFSNVLLVLYLWIFFQSLFISKSPKLFILLPVLQVVWVNTHIYYVFGVLLWLVFWLAAVFSKLPPPRLLVPLTLTGLGLLLANLINPLGLSGAISPVIVVNQNQSHVVENLNFFDYVNRYDFKPYLLVFVTSLTSLWLLILTKGKPDSVKRVILGMLILIGLGLALTMIRTIPIAGILITPGLSYGLHKWLSTYSAIKKELVTNRIYVTLGVLVIITLLLFPFVQTGRYPYLGIDPQILKAGEYLKKQKLPGPILNNFNSGGYVIYHLFPDQRVFIDQRAEAYPSDFFNDYMALEINPQVWKSLDERYRFQTIFVETASTPRPWVEFINQRLNDSNWQLVYQDSFAVILTRKTN